MKMVMVETISNKFYQPVFIQNLFRRHSVSTCDCSLQTTNRIYVIKQVHSFEKSAHILWCLENRSFIYPSIVDMIDFTFRKFQIAHHYILSCRHSVSTQG